MVPKSCCYPLDKHGMLKLQALVTSMRDSWTHDPDIHLSIPILMPRILMWLMLMSPENRGTHRGVRARVYAFKTPPQRVTLIASS